MSDFVFNAPDQPTLYGFAKAMGYWDVHDDVPIWQGKLPDGSGDYFLNEVGLVADLPGWWARLRLNGNNPFEDGALTIPAGLTVFPPGDDQPAIGLIA